MKSHLTRRVFRSILANEPIVHRTCLRRRTLSTIQAPADTRSTRTSTYRNGSPVVLPPQRRTFFDLGILGGKKKNVREAEIDPGLDIMMGLERRKRMQARLPSREDVADALLDFFKAKARQKTTLTDDQARLAHDSMRYCLDCVDDAEESQTVQDSKFLRLAATALRRSGSKPTESHTQLALLVYETMRKHRITGVYTAAHSYVYTLTRCHRTGDAMEFVRRFEPDTQVAPKTGPDAEKEPEQVEEPTADAPLQARQQIYNLWDMVMRGWSREDNEEALVKAAQEIKKLGYDVGKIASRSMLDFYLRRDDTKSVEHWLWRYWPTAQERMRKNPQDVHNISGFANMLACVFSWCLRHDQLALGHEIVRQAMAQNPPKLIWDAILVWAAGTGKGADEINRMFDVMEASNETDRDSKQYRRPDIVTINDLVEFAISKNDPYLAERFITIGKERNIQPDARTCVLQIKYRLKVNDIDGALIAYTNLQSMDISDDKDIPTVNQLMVALCSSKQHDFDTIMNVAADLSDRRAPFEPSTALALALLHLNRDEVHDVMDLLNTHAHHYSSTDREAIRNKILDICLDPKTSTSRAWDGYTVLRNVFDEMARSQRTELMVNFFSRERPDIATHVFTSMRTHSRADTLPTLDTYVAAFLACAKLRDIDVMEVIHNQLKLDYNIDTTTYLYNALMLGYTACGKPRRALEFWDNIVASKEGPTYNSIHIALRACEKAPFGDMKAQEVWRRLRRTSVELDQSMWASYAGALVGNGNTELAVTTVEEAEGKGEVAIDAYLVGSIFNGSPGQAKQAEVEDWAKAKYPQVWAEIEKIGVESDEGGMREVKIDRDLAP